MKRKKELLVYMLVEQVTDLECLYSLSNEPEPELWW